MTRNLNFTNVPRNLRCEGVNCPKHELPTLITRSGLQHVCIATPDCDFSVRLQGPYKEHAMVTKSNEKPYLSESERKKAIDEFAKKKAAATTSPGVVKPDKPPATKIPSAANVTTGKSKKELRRENAKKRDDADTVTVKNAVDKELDEAVKPKKPAADPNLLSVSDIARELGLDPKRARAKLRSKGEGAVEGRWPKVKRDSKDHKALVALLTPEPKVDADEDEEDEVEEDEE